MRVLFSSTRGTGHLQPLVPYARALLHRGHQVLVAGPAELEGPVREAGLPHAPFGHPGDASLSPLWARLRGLSTEQANALAVREIFAGANAVAALPQLQETIRAFRPDLIVRDSVEFAALVAAQRAGVPHARVAVHMVSFEETIPPLVREPIDRLRQDAGLPPDEGASLGSEPVFTAFPASLDGPAGESQRAPFRSRPRDDGPTADGTWATGDGRPLVYITFGTIAGGVQSAHAAYRAALDAVAELPVSALLTTGRGLPADALGTIPANVRVEPWVPQRDVLPHVAALVCHAGSGTLVGALGAGVPMVAVPLFADQPHNASRVEAVGAGLALSTRDSGALRTALQRVLGEPGFRGAARRLAEEIAALPPVDAAVDLFAGLDAR
ncbi:MAG TPA: glycosyltransferase [Polyangia bacterium]|nr:glycosyltransferase [Polyangia bacterium]